MRISEKTLELTLCSQISFLLHKWMWPNNFHRNKQPLWFGLTQKQEARAGFDAATRLNCGRILMLQYKAGKRLQNGKIRFHAPHTQLTALQTRVNNQKRLIYYVLPAITQTRELTTQNSWVMATTWLLDVADIPPLGKPHRSSGLHLIILDTKRAIVEIKSDPVEVKVTNAAEIMNPINNGVPFGTKFDTFESMWKYAKALGTGAVAAALPERL